MFKFDCNVTTAPAEKRTNKGQDFAQNVTSCLETPWEKERMKVGVDAALMVLLMFAVISGHTAYRIILEEQGCL